MEKNPRYFHATLLFASFIICLSQYLFGSYKREEFYEWGKFSVSVIAVFVLECVYHLLPIAERKGILEESIVMFLRKLIGWAVIVLSVILFMMVFN